MSSNSNTPYLVDSHCHLDRLNADTSQHSNLFPEAAIKAAQARGVRHFLCIGVDLETWADVQQLAEQWPCVHATVGVHPLYQKSREPECDELVELAQHPKVVAIGETGLDYFYAKENNQWQKGRFVTHIQAAEQTGLPLVVHTRGAQADTLNLIREHGQSRVTGVLHCFTEDLQMAKAAIDLGFYISISGIVTFNNASALRDVVKALPLDRLLIETDSPWLAPTPYRGKQNQPAYVYEVAERVAQLKNVSLARLAEQTSRNYFSLFDKVTPVEPV